MASRRSTRIRFCTDRTETARETPLDDRTLLLGTPGTGEPLCAHRLPSGAAIDKLGRIRLQENIERYKEKLLETWEELPPIFLTSAEKGDGRDEVINYIEQINSSINNE